MSRTAGAASAVLTALLVAGCPGTAGKDPCAAVTCAPGRACVNGTCWPAGESCTVENPCPADQQCVNGRCVAVGVDLGAYDLYATVPDTKPRVPDLPLPDTAVVDQLIPPDQPPLPDIDVGRWYQVDTQNCLNFCASIGRSNVAGPDSSHCMSGECRSASGIQQGIVFTYGCNHAGCPPQGPHQATSYGGYCYKPAQKQDDDATDRTVGCYCK